MKAILGKKIGMTQLFNKDGVLIPVTIIKATPNEIVQIKNLEKDGYQALKVGFEDKKKNIKKPQENEFKKAKVTPKRYLREIKVDNIENYKLGDKISVDSFEELEYIDVTSKSKGKGFQGSIKRHNQSRGPMSHGSRYHRRSGSMGAVAPVVFKGKKLPGHMGAITSTIQNLVIVKILKEDDLIIVKGSIPGPKNSLVFIKSSIKKSKKYDGKTDLNINFNSSQAKEIENQENKQKENLENMETQDTNQEKENASKEISKEVNNTSEEVKKEVKNNSDKENQENK